MLFRPKQSPVLWIFQFKRRLPRRQQTRAAARNDINLRDPKMKPEIISWLLEGDPSIRWQVQRDLLNSSPSKYEAERRKIAKEGWGTRLLALQDSSGTWGGGIYGPKWISTTYTMLTLRLLGLQTNHPQAKRACKIFLDKGVYTDGGINFFSYSLKYSETCVTGMILALLAYFRYPDEYISFHRFLFDDPTNARWRLELRVLQRRDTFILSHNHFRA